MPAKRELTMRQLRHLLRLHHEGVSAREIGRRLGVARSTIQDGVVTLSNDRREASRSRGPQIAAAATRHVSIAEARKARCVRAEMRWR
jgi:IS30 family transposase